MGSSVITSNIAQRQTPAGLTLPLPSPLLAMLPPALQGYPMQWWNQPVNFFPINHNTTAVQGFTTDNTHFLAAWYGCVSVRSNDNQTDEPNMPLLVSITDTKNLNYNPAGFPIDVRNVFGSAQQPAVWPMPLIVANNGGLNLSLTNNHNANNLNVQFAFLGVLISVPTGFSL